jgi:hypothetical protein
MFLFDSLHYLVAVPILVSLRLCGPICFRKMPSFLIVVPESFKRRPPSLKPMLILCSMIVVEKKAYLINLHKRTFVGPAATAIPADLYIHPRLSLDYYLLEDIY